MTVENPLEILEYGENVANLFSFIDPQVRPMTNLNPS